MTVGIKGFQPGNKVWTTRSVSAGGRPPKFISSINDEIAEHPERVGLALAKLYEMGIGGDRDALEYYIDRVWGKPKGLTESHVSVVIGTPEDYKRAQALMLADKTSEITLIDSPQDAVQCALASPAKPLEPVGVVDNPLPQTDAPTAIVVSFEPEIPVEPPAKSAGLLMADLS